MSRPWKLVCAVGLALGLALGVVLGIRGCSGPEPAKAPAPKEAKVRPGTMELRRWTEPAERVVIEPGGVAVGAFEGSEEEPLRHYLFVTPDRLQDLDSFVRTYAPFKAATSRGELAFGGRGTTAAGPAEQRMIAEWARLVAAEVAAGRGSASSAMIFAWHRGGAVGSCDDLAVYLTGEVRAGSCVWGDEIRGRLASAPLARLYGWFDNLAPFQEGSEEGNDQVREPSRLVFAGQGSKPATADEIAAVRAFAAALHRELSARRTGAPAPAGDGEEGSERLLVPVETAAAGRATAAIPEELVVPAAPSAPTPTLPRAAAAPPPRAGEGAPSQETKKSESGEEQTEGTPPP